MVSTKKIWIYLIILLSTFDSLLIGQSKTPIEVLISSDNRIYEQGLYGIQSVSDFELKVSYLDIITSENPDVSSYFKSLESSNPPFVITIGPAATKMAQENLKKIPIIFSMVNAPKSLGLENDNICGVSMDISVSEYFQTLKDIDPNIKTIYSFYSTEDGAYSSGEGEYTDLKYKLLFNKKKIVDKKDFKKELEQLAGKIDAFLMVNDPLYGKAEFEELSKFCKENKIILMTSFPALVKVGATFGISPDYSKIGVLTGMMANKINSKLSTCEAERVLLPDQSSFFLNEVYAKESGINIPNSIVERAKLTRLFDVGINLINEGKLNSAKTVFDAILKKDPTNKSAASFLQVIIEKQSGSKIKDLQLSAEMNMKNKRYAQARSDFQKILSINPNITSAREGIQASLLAQSEQERAMGNEYARSGKPFDAIKMFLASLRTLPTNAKATNDLNTIRSQESSNIPAYIKRGIALYNERDYEKSIEIFENALLVSPGHKEAQEYLRLSYKKKEAIVTLKKKLGIE
jgi:ABC-type uncharacterized transport system substrate-binding protein/Tfp pilus assembly protein PilF